MSFWDMLCQRSVGSLVGIDMECWHLPLNLTIIKSIVPVDGKPKRKSDGGGLFIEATPAGSKLWKMTYWIGKRQKTLSFGAWPTVSLVDARAMREAAKKLLAEGQDPAEAKKAIKSGSDVKTFDRLAHEFIEFRRNETNPDEKRSSTTIDKYEWSRQAVSRQIGGTPITELKLPDIVSALRVIEKTGAMHKAIKARSFIDQVYDYAGSCGIPVVKPGPTIKRALYKPKKRSHAGLTDPNMVGELIRAMDSYSGDASTCFALRLSVYVFLRAGEMRTMRWSWVNFDEKYIEVDPPFTKMKRKHFVPLSDQSLNLMREIHQFSGRNDYVFPSKMHKGRYMSENTLNGAIRRMGFTKAEQTFHGLRTTASTLLNEIRAENLMVYSERAIEKQLSHTSMGSVEGSYNKSELIKERIPMMQIWADTVDKLRELPQRRG